MSVRLCYVLLYNIPVYGVVSFVVSDSISLRGRVLVIAFMGEFDIEHQDTSSVFTMECTNWIVVNAKYLSPSWYLFPQPLLDVRLFTEKKWLLIFWEKITHFRICAKGYLLEEVSSFKIHALVLSWIIYFVNQLFRVSASEIIFYSFEFFTIKKSDAFLSEYLTDLKLHRTK